jgi:O-antigen/teichoic acid export membrane protein
MINIIKNNKLYSNSLIFLVGSIVGSFGSYIYNFLMARMLGPEGYGELQSILAMIAILGIPLATLSTVVIKYVASLEVRGEFGKIFHLLRSLTLKLLIGGFLFFIIFLVLSNFVARFLHLTSVVPLIILSIGMVVAFMNSINSGMIQGLQKFKELSIIGIASVGIKVLFGYLLVKYSFHVSGAVGAVVLSGVAGYALAWLPLRFLFKYRKKENIRDTQAILSKKEMMKYSLPVLISFFFVTWMMNIDILLVKHFFEPGQAGQYAALAVLGHIIYFVIGPLVSVMFPMSVAAHSGNGNSGRILKNSIILATVVGAIGVVMYFLIPEFIIKIIMGGRFLDATPYLGWFGLSMLAYSIIYLLSQYFLSINKVKFVYLLGVGAVLQLVLILFFHSTVWQIVWVMNSTMGVTLVLLLIYLYATRKNNISHSTGI